MKVQKGIIFALSLSILAFAGCGSANHGLTIDGEKALETDGTYTTQTRLSALEYSIFMNKQVTVFTNNLSTHMALAQNSKNFNYDANLVTAQNSLDQMQDALDEVIVTYPSQGSDNDRETAITTMKTAISHMNEYIEKIKNNEDISNFASYFENDFLGLTSVASLYYQ